MRLISRKFLKRDEKFVKSTAIDENEHSTNFTKKCSNSWIEYEPFAIWTYFTKRFHGNYFYFQFLVFYSCLCIYYKNNQQVVKKILTSKKLFGQKNNPIALTISWEFIVNPYDSSIGKLADFCIIEFGAYLVTWRDIIYWSHITKKSM